MTLVKYKNQIEYSFITWMNHYPESNHPTDDENFYCFVKNVCRYARSKRWKDTNFLKNKIKKRKPNFNPVKLANIITFYKQLLDFYKAKYLPSSWFIDPDARKIKHGYYIERGVRNGELYEIEKPKKQYISKERR
ncbi:MAG: hypothetical protein U9R14_04825 [Patescibacteria group bacterium]|nr:hypothetical protein [Patescibacteria group bacterium]